MSIKILTDSLHRIAYSTDASAYREVPAGVAYPEGCDDIAELVSAARRKGTCLIPRAGGTSLAGQVVGSGFVADVSRNLNHILEIDSQQRWALVEPGVVLDELNLACKPFGLFFSPETSTSNRCCLGGMFGNNSCGSHSLVYGSTRRHILEAEVVLSDGSVETVKEYSVAELEERFGEGFWKDSKELPLAGKIYSQMLRFASDGKTVRTIEENYPDKSLKRRSCGYAIDEALAGLTDGQVPWKERRINLCRLLCGSEGTLAFTAKIKVSLDPLPPRESVAVVAHCEALEKSFLANLVALKHRPVAIELIDSTILELSKQNEGQKVNRFFVEGDPAAILVIEIRGDKRAEIEAAADSLEKDLMEDSRKLVYRCTRVYGNDIQKVWSLRKAGLGLLNGMKGDSKPVGVIEDTAVAPENLPGYMEDFRKILDRFGLDCAFYGHISTGELHLRPIINLKTREGRKLFREIAGEMVVLVKKHRGSLSGEHGDGRLRGEFIPVLYGEEAYGLMREVKRCWDPDGVFNVGKIIDSPPMDESLRFDLWQEYEIEKELSTGGTYFNWKAAFDECRMKHKDEVPSQTRALMCSIEQCNGSGDCRKSNLMGGTLCPAYKVSRDETWSTRARANTLREILTQGWNSEAFAEAKHRGSVFEVPELKEVLDSCLACKGCRGECPSNVDMTRLRSELLQHIHDKKGISFRSIMVARMAVVERLGSKVAPVYNFFAKGKLSSGLIKKILEFSSERQIPSLSRRTMRQLVASECSHPGKPATKRKVYLFADEFTDFQEAELGLKFARLLRRLGYEVEIPRHGESGRAAISKGDLKYARKCAVRNVSLLKDLVSSDAPLVGIEPSCILSFRDEYPDLVPQEKRAEAQRLGANCLLYDEFLSSEISKGHVTSESFSTEAVEIWLHGHCHQKALIGTGKTVEMLSVLKGATIHVIPSGCCGMAGSFGYEKEHYRTSLEIGEMVLFPAVRKAVGSAAGASVVIAAPGTSCRQQIKDGTGVTAVHPLEILYGRLAAPAGD